MYAFVIFLLFRLKKVDDKWLRHQKKEIKPVYEIRKPVHKNIYYDVIYDNNNSISNNSNTTNNTSVETDWKSTENSDVVYEQDKVEMNMFRDDSDNTKLK